MSINVDPSEISIEPQLHTRDGRIIGSLGDAIALLREHEGRQHERRPGVDDRDEVLHRLEHTQTDRERQQAAQAFVVWAKEIGLLPARPRISDEGRA